MNPKVYLAGPIGGLSYAGATTWRAYALSQLAELRIVGVNPMRSKEFLAGSAAIDSDLQSQYTHPFATNKGILGRDHHDATSADALLVNFLEARDLSVGTAMEIAWAYDRHIPTVVVDTTDSRHMQHPMLSEAVNFRVDTLDAGIEIIQQILCPGVEQ